MSQSNSSVLSRNPDIVACNVDAQFLMMSIENGSYYNLDETAARIWDILSQPMSLDALVDILSKEFRVSREVCRQDTAEFIDVMLSESLLLDSSH